MKPRVRARSRPLRGTTEDSGHYVPRNASTTRRVSLRPRVWERSRPLPTEEGEFGEDCHGTAVHTGLPKGRVLKSRFPTLGTPSAWSAGSAAVPILATVRRFLLCGKRASSLDRGADAPSSLLADVCAAPAAGSAHSVLSDASTETTRVSSLLAARVASSVRKNASPIALPD